MTDYRLSAIATVLALSAVIPVAILPILARTVRRYGRLRGWPMAMAIGLIGASLALAAYTVLPLPSATELQCTGGHFWSYWITDPRASISPILRTIEDDGLRAMLRSYPFEQFALNIALFVPFGFFLHQVTRWNVITTTALGFLMSTGIELTQGTGFLRVYPCPYRHFDVADIIANTGGALAGGLASLAVVAAIPAVTPTPVPDLAPPSLGRRGIATLIDLSIVTAMAAGVVGAFAVHRSRDGGREAAVAVLENRLAWALALACASLLVTIAHALLRRDRATPGQAVVNIGPALRADPPASAHAWQVAVRWLVRWAPIAAAPLVPLLPIALALAEIACASFLAGSTSLAGAAARTRTLTLPSIAAHPRGDARGAPTEAAPHSRW